MADCLANKLSKSVLKMVSAKAVPYQNCSCLWCCEAKLAKDTATLWPACACESCATHPANHSPDHFLRVCSHRVYWTVNQGDRDECAKCDDEKQRAEALSNLPLPDYPLFDERTVNGITT